MNPGLESLFRFHRELRGLGLGLGPDDLVLVLRCVEAGLGLESDAALIALCRRLWVRSPEEGVVFDERAHSWSSRLAAMRAARHPTAGGSSARPREATGTRQDGVARSSEANPGSSKPPRPEASPEDAEPEWSPSAQSELASGSRQSPRTEGTSAVAFRVNRRDDLPLSLRETNQLWRRLRRRERRGPACELDLAETLRLVARQGVLASPAFRPRKRDCATLLLLVDQAGTMIPLESLSQRLLAGAEDEGGFASLRIRYFDGERCDRFYREPTAL